MAMTNAERQRKYRERALSDPDGLLLTRVQVLIEPHAHHNLERLVKHLGKNKREVVEQAINELAIKLNCNY